jgi:uncharacterized membrane protein YfcA
MANATNAVAMMPGSLASAWAYRRELRAHTRSSGYSPRPRSSAGSRERCCFTPPLLLVGVYGGFFGAAMGIVTLALLSLRVEPRRKDPTITRCQSGHRDRHADVTGGG